MRFFPMPGGYEFIPFVISAAIHRLDSEDDRRFMAELYLSCSRQLLSYAARLTDNRADAEDAVQDAFLSLIPKVTLLRGMEEARLKGYVFISVRNAVYMLKRKDRRRAALETAEYTEETIRTAGTPLYRYPTETLCEAILKLNERDRTLLQMKYFQEQSDAEIAAMLQIKESSVRVLTGRARARLSKLLQEGGAEDE